MKKFNGIISALKLVIKYGAIIFAVIETIEFFVKKLEEIQSKDA